MSYHQEITGFTFWRTRYSQQQSEVKQILFGRGSGPDPAGELTNFLRLDWRGGHPPVFSPRCLRRLLGRSAPPSPRSNCSYFTTWPLTLNPN